jgi:hypothetical protein
LTSRATVVRLQAQLRIIQGDCALPSSSDWPSNWLNTESALP